MLHNLLLFHYTAQAVLFTRQSRGSHGFLRLRQDDDRGCRRFRRFCLQEIVILLLHRLYFSRRVHHHCRVSILN